MRGVVVVGAALTALLGGVAGCNSTSFKSDNPKRAADARPVKPTDSSDQTFKLACENGTGEAKLVTEMRGAKASTVRLEGEFCGIPNATQAGKLTVLFILDFSGSMLQNDPEVLGSCGRLKAGQAIYDKLVASRTDGAEVAVALQAFGEGAIPGTDPVDLDAFQSHLTPEEFCSGDGGATNYEAAFTQGHELLQSIDGSKVVYFISDGLPTRMGNGGGILGGGIGPILGDVDTGPIYEAGRKAAETLRSLPGLTLNALYLGNIETEQFPGVVDVKPEDYLEQIAGDKEHVRLATNADQLAAEIVTLETPEAANLDAASVRGEVATASLGTADVKVASLTKDPAREGVWSFVTEPFLLYGDLGKAVENTVTFTVKAADGKDHKATAVITFVEE